MIECVANISEGRRAAVIGEIVAALRFAGPPPLSLHSDADHNRSVLTFVGSAESLLAGVIALARYTTARIDVTQHRGVHPRIGALDVVPFVPLGSTEMAECVSLARRVGERMARECGLPVYLYGQAAAGDERRTLASIRRGGLTGLEHRMTREGFLPDYGPSRLHPTAGAVAVGARRALVAYNIQLESTDLRVAQRIAAVIRERDGGLPGVQALGLRLESRGCVQVSMNLTCLERTNLREAFEAVVRLASELGIGVRDSEIVGLAPRMAFGGATTAELCLPGEVNEYLLEPHLEGLCRFE